MLSLLFLVLKNINMLPGYWISQMFYLPFMMAVIAIISRFVGQIQGYIDCIEESLIKQMHKYPWFMVGNGNHIKSMIALENMVDMTYFMINKFKPGVQNFNCIDKPYLTVKQLMRTISKNDGFSMPIVYIPFWFSIAIGKVFDVFGKIINKDLPINSDRMKKFGTSTDYRAEKIREMGYVQQHSIEDVFKKTCEWYLKVNSK